MVFSFYGALKLKDYNRNTIHEHNSIGDTQLIVDTLDFKLIDRFENIVFGSVEINKFNIKVFLGSVLTVEDETIAKQLLTQPYLLRKSCRIYCEA